MTTTPPPQDLVERTLPPIPARMRDQPVQGGLAIPWIALQLPDKTWDLAGCHARKVNLSMLDGRCQLCSQRIYPPYYFFAAHDQVEGDPPYDLDSPPLHQECAEYAAAVCPMLYGRLTQYRTKASRAHRTDECSTPGCDCGGWKMTEETEMAARGGLAAPTWYLVKAVEYDRLVPAQYPNLVRHLRVGLGSAGGRITGRITHPLSITAVGWLDGAPEGPRRPLS